MKHDSHFKLLSLGINWVWLMMFALLPFALVTAASFLTHNEKHLLQLPTTLFNYAQLKNPVYFSILMESLYLAGICTLICLLLGYPFAYAIAHMTERVKSILVLMIILPFWTSLLIRTYSMIAMLKLKGIINTLLLGLDIIDKPLPLLFSDTAVIIGTVYNLLPFMVLPLITNIERLDNRLVDAARDLGANRFTTFRKIILPLTMPGILSGCILVFFPAMTIFYIPDLLGGAKTIMLGSLIQNQFLVSQNWPLGSAISIVFTLFFIILLIIYWHSRHGKEHRKHL